VKAVQKSMMGRIFVNKVPVRLKPGVKEPWNDIIKENQ